MIITYQSPVRKENVEGIADPVFVCEKSVSYLKNSGRQTHSREDCPAMGNPHFFALARIDD